MNFSNQLTTPSKITTKVGDLIIAGTQRLVIPDDQDAQIHIQYEKEAIDFKIKFESDSNNKESILRYEGKGDYAQLTFKNWNNPLGQVTAAPIRVGVTDGGLGIHFMAVCWVIGKTRILEIQTMIGGAE